MESKAPAVTHDDLIEGEVDDTPDLGEIVEVPEVDGAPTPQREEEPETSDDDGEEEGEAEPPEPPSLIIVGGSWQAMELARLNPGCLIIEKEASWVKRLDRDLPDCRFLVGDGSDPEVLEGAGAAKALWLVLLTGSDDENLRVARTASEAFPKLQILSGLETKEGSEALRELGVQPIPCGTATLPSVLNDLLHPHPQDLAQVFLVAGHPWVEERLARIEVPGCNQAVAVRRGDELLAPNPELLLAENDTLLLQCTEAPGSLVGQALSSPETVRPFHRFLVTMTEGGALVGRFKEALVLSQTSGARLMLAGPADMQTLMDEATAEAQAVDVEVEQLHWGPGGVRELLRTGEEHQIGIEGERPRQADCVILPPPKQQSALDWFLGRAPMVNTMLGRGHPPILVARTFGPYRSVLFVIDGRKLSQQVTSYALRMARLFDAELHVLVYRGYDHDKVESQRRTLKRAMEAYRLKLTETVIESHRGLEFIQHLRSGEVDLAVTSARSRTLRRDLLVTALLRAPCSLLVIP